MHTGDELTLQKMLEMVAEYRASDLHLSVGNPPILRVDAKLVPLHDFPILTKDFLESSLDIFLDRTQRVSLERDREVIVAYPFHKQGRFRVHIFYQRGSVGMSFRFIGERLSNLKALGLPPSVEKLVDLKSGLVIISGPFGSGRTSVISALVSAINHKRQEYVVTIEKPIEHIFPNEKSVVEQREVGRDTPSFKYALAGVSQEDVNVVMVSELEDAEVIRMAVSLALSGRLIMGVLNTDTAVKTIDHLLNTYSNSERQRARTEISEAIAGVVCLRLVPRVGGGQILVAEVLLGNTAVRSVIKDGNIEQLNNVIQTSREEGMVSLDHSLVQLVRTGEVRIHDALAHAQDRQGLTLLAQTM